MASSVINIFDLHFINNTCSYSLRYYASYIPPCCISYLCKIPKSWLNNQCLKKQKRQRKEKYLNWMENFNIESRYLKFCNKFRAVTRCMWKLLLTNLIIKNCSSVHWSKDSPKHLFQNMGRSLWNTQSSF